MGYVALDLEESGMLPPLDRRPKAEDYLGSTKRGTILAEGEIGRYDVPKGVDKVTTPLERLGGAERYPILGEIEDAKVNLENRKAGGLGLVAVISGDEDLEVAEAIEEDDTFGEEEDSSDIEEEQNLREEQGDAIAPPQPQVCLTENNVDGVEIVSDFSTDKVLDDVLNNEMGALPSGNEGISPKAQGEDATGGLANACKMSQRYAEESSPFEGRAHPAMKVDALPNCGLKSWANIATSGGKPAQMGLDGSKQKAWCASFWPSEASPTLATTTTTSTTVPTTPTTVLVLVNAPTTTAIVPPTATIVPPIAATIPLIAATVPPTATIVPASISGSNFSTDLLLPNQHPM
ncbi:hypothetical protein U1Q18_009531 [Sarracenia purpurea var. burkii]